MINLKIDDSKLRQLNENENQILKFIYSRGADICDMSVQRFASEVSCAPSSIIRFCKKIGLSGFSELKYVLSKDDVPKKSEASIEQDISFGTILSDITTDLRGTANLLENDDIYRIADLLLSEIPLYLYYPGGITDSLVRYLEKLLMISGRPKVFQLHSGNMTEHLINTIPHDAIIIFISASGTWGKTVSLARNASLHNLITVGITPYTNNPVAANCRYNLRFFTHPKENQGTEYTSRLCIFYTIDTLIAFYRMLKRGDEQDE